MFWEPPGGLSSSAFSDAELSVLHAVGGGSGFFPGAVVVRCWCGSESAIRDFAPSARCWRSRVANVSHLVQETEKWWKLPLFPVGCPCSSVETGARRLVNCAVSLLSQRPL